MRLSASRYLRAGLWQHLLLIMALASCAAAFVHYQLLWRWDNLLYDAQLSLWNREPPDDIIIVGIDDESLYELGRWPWPRSTHAQLINRINLESPAVIGLDILFSEPDNSDPLSDVLLARALRSRENVVLPVYMALESQNAYPIEALPLPEFTDNAAALGHVHVDISDDGIARKVYLQEGIGKPYWEHYSLAILAAIDDPAATSSRTYDLPDTHYSLMQWYREKPYLIPFAGPPGHFQQIGYAQVLAGNYPKNLFRDKIVLVGTTAEGMVDALPTPMSGDGGAMAGVEIVANVIDGLRNQIHITTLEEDWLLLVTVLLVALPLFIYPYVSPASTLLVLLLVVLGTVIATGLLLWLAGIWLALSTILLFQFLSYPLWSWRRLVLAMHHINTELDALTEQQRNLRLRRERNVVDEMAFIAGFMEIHGWVLESLDGERLLEHGSPPDYKLGSLQQHGWQQEGYRYWARVSYQQRECRLGLSFGPDIVISDEEKRLLDNLIEAPLTAGPSQRSLLGDVIEDRILQVQAVASEYQSLRQIIDDSLQGMADGILICDSHGHILTFNRRAGWYLLADDNADIKSRTLLQLLANVTILGNRSWASLIRACMLDGARVLTEARHESGRDLMVEISPVRIIDDQLDGMVINLSDISMLKASERERNETLNFLSHDLRSPLASMLALIELARDKTSIEDMRNMLDEMQTSTDKTLHLAEQFLQLSRANTTVDLEFYECDFNTLVLNAVDQLYALARTSGVAIETQFEQEELWMLGEPDLLERSLVNLLSNAVKHSPTGARVTVTVILDNGVINCCVIDQGDGIDPDELPHLFDMYRRTRGSASERKRGSGLGLAFVDAVARRHSGHIDVESAPGQGSSFCLRLPHLAVDEDATADA